MNLKLKIDLNKSTEEIVATINTYLMSWTCYQREKLITYIGKRKQEINLSGFYVNNIGYPYLSKENKLETNLQQLLARFTNNALEGISQLHTSIQQQEEVKNLKQTLEQEKALKVTAFTFILKQNKFEEFTDFLKNDKADQKDYIWDHFNKMKN